jgi:hypothetical protein
VTVPGRGVSIALFGTSNVSIQEPQHIKSRDYLFEKEAKTPTQASGSPRIKILRRRGLLRNLGAPSVMKAIWYYYPYQIFVVCAGYFD